MSLGGNHIRQIYDAILSGYDRAELALLMRTELNEDLDTIAGNEKLNEVVRELLAWSERTGNLPLLVETAARGRPNNTKLSQLLVDMQSWDFAELPNEASEDSFSAPTRRFGSLGLWAGIGVAVLALILGTVLVIVIITVFAN